MPRMPNTSRENGRSFLMSVAGGNTTSFAGNAKGTASRASVPPLCVLTRIGAKSGSDFRLIFPKRRSQSQLQRAVCKGPPTNSIKHQKIYEYR